MKTRCTIFCARVRPLWIPQKAHQDTLCRTCVCSYDGICGSVSAFWWDLQVTYCILVGSGGRILHSGVQNIDVLCFMLDRDQHGFHKSALGHVAPNLCFRIWWDLRVRYCILMCETSTHSFSCSGGTGMDSMKSASEDVTLNLCFCIR
jgi:hypothetical protein